jgi:HAMP domain-containing protein
MVFRRVSADFAAGKSPHRITAETTEIEQLATAT